MNEYAAELERINGNVASTYAALSEMGATMPEQQNSNNLPGTARTVPQGGGTSVQTDWNQKDETAPDFLKNKPFGDVVTEIMPETEVVGIDEGGLYMVPIEQYTPSGTEETLIVSYDGVKYICPVIGEEYGFKIFGNANIIEDGLGGADEPFCIDLFGLLGGIPIIFLLDQEQHTIGIDATAIEKLDTKYVTNFASFYISTEFDDNPFIYTDNMLSNKATKADLMNAATTQTIQVYATPSGLPAIMVSPYVVNFFSGYIEFRNWKAGNTGKDFGIVYTAEYTPET